MSNEFADLDDAIEKSRLWQRDALGLMDGLPFPNNVRNRVSVALFHLSVEHYQGIHILVDEEKWGTAFALFRPQLEAYVRGAWFAICAVDADLDRFLIDQEPPPFDTLVNDLEQHNVPYTRGALNQMRGELWKQLCSFTHGGMMQVFARNDAGRVVQNIDIPHILGLMKASSYLACAACLTAAQVSNSPEIASKLHDAFQAIYGNSTGD